MTMFEHGFITCLIHEHPIDYFVVLKCFLKIFSERANRELSNGILLIKIGAQVAEISLFEAAKTVMGDVKPDSGKKLIKHH